MTKSTCYNIAQCDSGVVGLFNAIDRDIHRQKRKAVGRVINDQSMRKFEPVMHKEIDIYLRQLLQSSRTSTTIDMSSIFGYLTMDMTGWLAFDFPLNLQTEPTFRFMVDSTNTSNFFLNMAMQIPSLYKFPLISSDRIRTMIRGENYFKALDDMIKRQLNRDDDAKQQLAFLSENFTINEDMDIAVKEIRNEAIFFLTAGKKTRCIIID